MVGIAACQDSLANAAREMTADETHQLQERILAGFPDSAGFDEALKALWQTEPALNEKVEESPGALAKLLDRLSLTQPESVFATLIFTEELVYERVPFDHLDRFLDDAWRPVAEDFLFAPVSLEWVMMIHHEGYAILLK